MKKVKLLILTSEYPNPNSTYDTPVVHYFAKEWINMGFDVRVIHYRSVFPSFFYSFARIFKGFLKRVFKTDFIPDAKLSSRVEYQLDSINILSQPIFKLFPHIKFFKSTISHQAKLIFLDNQALEFVPDVIIGHFVNPQLPLIAALRSYYPNAKTSIVLHENPKFIKDLFGRKSFKILENFDYIGFRYEEMKNIFVKLFGDQHKFFLCPSGIPDKYILPEIPNGKFSNDKISICFIGMLIPLKNIDIILEALYLAFPNKNFELKIFGEGMLHHQIDKKIKLLNLEDCVSLEGKVSRDEVQIALTNMDVFVMVSKPEAFGLVYVEAMGKGCITIGTKGQGIDGIIRHEENGFLCEARNIQDLKHVFETISSMSYDEKLHMADSALKKAADLTDRKVAISYLKNIEVL